MTIQMTETIVAALDLTRRGIDDGLQIDLRRMDAMASCMVLRSEDTWRGSLPYRSARWLDLKVE